MKLLPEVYYGLHMVEGVAEYAGMQDVSGENMRYFVAENTIKAMDATFPGRPVFVDHVPQVDLETLQESADGWVAESFFNKADGKHWAKFIAVSDRAKDAIRQGWKLSNAYEIVETRAGGKWHGVDYQKEVTLGRYDHLAIVQVPRYQESIILTPEQFKEYNAAKEAELLRLANSADKKPVPPKEEKKTMFNLFKKEKVQNSDELTQMSVKLPKSGKEVEIAKLINDADDVEMNSAEQAGKPVMANGDHKVKVGDQEMTVNELVAKHVEMCAKNTAAPAEEKKPANGDPELTDENAAQGDDDKKPLNETDAELAERKKKTESVHFNSLDTAEETENNERLENSGGSIELPEDRVARGKNLFGSSK